MTEYSIMVKRNCQTILNIIILIICIYFNATVSEIIKNVNLSRNKGDKIDSTTQSNSEKEDSQNDLVSDFFDHVQEIFQHKKPDTVNVTYLKRNFSPTKSPSSSSVTALRFLETTTKKNKILALFDNKTVSSTIKYKFRTSDSGSVSTYKLLSTELFSTESMSVQKIAKHYQKKTKKTTKPTITLEDDDDMLDTESSLGPISTENERDLDIMDQQTRKLSCIICDNVSNKDCNNPENKLLPLINCDRNSDVCYTMQTPFGIVDRGCYSSLENHTTYVCSCNLCNTIPIHDLPQSYTNKTEWLYNVQELSHGGRLRKSVYRQMACVQCEVNQTIDDVPDINCLEGKYRILPSQYCKFDEICGIRSIRSQGYIWRGCIKYPRYNYLWSFCDNDLCNFDAPTSLFDIE